MGKKNKLLHFRLPKLRFSTRGVKLQRPTMRVGGKAGMNVSSQGVSGSVRAKGVSVSTKRGCLFSPLSFLFK